ncbi:MAG: 23S rRNA (guanosine(2251)-2'-O)-methyltransferase RlmB [Candidatus Hydrogenedentes bacterium]|nr:23S rRNA (guanosine(2251)-2'-O)-methyltransferase RlmB [Candidatus Hydrogenedentota bacterium]
MAESLIHGVNAVTEGLRAGGRADRLYVASDAKVRGCGALLEIAREKDVRVEYVPQAKLNELTGTHEHQGVALRVSPVAYAELSAVLEHLPRQALLLALDQVQHPRTFGMMLRSAWGAGVQGVIVGDKGGALVDDSVVRASAGAVLHVPVIKQANLTQCLKTLKDHGFWVHGLAGDGAEDVFALPWAERVVLVVGNETSGLRPGVRKVCDALVRIPLAHGVDSLNASIAASIALFQVSAAHGRSARPT